MSANTPLPLRTRYTTAVSEDVKVSLLATLAAWLPRVSPDALAPAVPAQLLAALKDGARENLRRAAARCVLAAVRVSPGLAPALLLGGAAEVCLKWVSDALPKPALRLDGVLGAVVVARALQAADATGGCGLYGDHDIL